ncbi:MAG: rhomboid family intramembrane serine protease, partial [Myxococcota bacterium]
MSSMYRRGLDLDPRNAGPAAKWLPLSMVAATALFAVTGRSLGFGADNFHYDVSRLLAGELWRLATYPFVAFSGLSLLLGAGIFYLFAVSFERQWGTRDFLQFAAFSTIGAAVLAIPLRLGLNLFGLFNDPGVYAGPGPVIDAMLVALALTAPDANIMFGFVLPMRAKTAVYLVIAIEVLFALVDGTTRLSLTLGGLAMGYLLISGNWRPSRWGGFIKKKPPKRRGLYVVPPKN